MPILLTIFLEYEYFFQSGCSDNKGKEFREQTVELVTSRHLPNIPALHYNNVSNRYPDRVNPYPDGCKTYPGAVKPYPKMDNHQFGREERLSGKLYRLFH